MQIVQLHELSLKYDIKSNDDWFNQQLTLGTNLLLFDSNIIWIH